MVSNGVQSKGERLLGVFLSLNLLVPFANGWLAKTYGYSGEASGILATLHQGAFSLGAVLWLAHMRRALPTEGADRSVWITSLQGAFLLLGIADLAYGLFAYIIQLPPPRGNWPLFYELPYAFYSIAVAVAAYQRATDGLRRLERRTVELAIAAVGAAFLFCTYKMLLVPFFDITPARPPVVGGCVIAYSIGQSLFLGSILVTSLRATGFREFFFWFAFLLLIASDFTIRTQEIGAPVSSLSFFDYGWHFSVVAAGSLLLLISRSPAPRNELLHAPAPLSSIRVLSSGVALCSLIAFIGVTWIMDSTLDESMVKAVSGKLMILTVVWAFSNIVSLIFSQLLKRTNDRLSLEIHKIRQLDDIQLMATSPIEYRGILDALRAMDEKLKASMQENVRLESMAAIGKVTAQVAHDIRSPLAALEVLTQEISTLPEDLRVLVRNSVGRIRDIANDLVSRKGRTPGAGIAAPNAIQPPESDSVVLVSTLIDAIVSEKRINLGEHRPIEIQAEYGHHAYGTFVKVNTTEFNRMLSNLLNNAIEAISGPGRVLVQLTGRESRVEIRITDTGKGISPEQLKRIGQAGATFGKAGGSGLGLHHAIETCRIAGGALDIQSEPGLGTLVTLELPRAAAPSWFVPGLEIQQGMSILVLDDDPSVHSIWSKRFQKHLGPNRIEAVRCFRSADELRTWMQENQPTQDKILALVDFELSTSQSDGLELIRELDIANRSVLVTSHYGEAPIETQVSRLGMGMIPKGMAGLVPIQDEIPTPPLRLRRRTRSSERECDGHASVNAQGSA